MKTQTILLSVLLLSSAVTLIPGAGAHVCRSSDDSCDQPCQPGNHNHTWYENGQQRHCASYPEVEPQDVVCAVYRIVRDLLDSDAVIPPPCETGDVADVGS